jgi:hypothetical protein
MFTPQEELAVREARVNSYLNSTAEGVQCCLHCHVKGEVEFKYSGANPDPNNHTDILVEIYCTNCLSSWTEVFRRSAVRFADKPHKDVEPTSNEPTYTRVRNTVYFRDHGPWDFEQKENE